MRKYLKILKKRYKPVLAALVLLLIALQFVPFRVFIKKSDVGGGYLKENQEEVEFLCFGDIYNPVSYTHLDVYKRQGPDGCGFHRHRCEEAGAVR